MDEALSPNTKQKGPFSPTKFVLGSNNDQLERAQARAARAAIVRSKPLPAPSPTTTDQILEREQILELLQNCIKLSSENKINQKNTWDLNLIDHLCEIVKVEEEKDAETNFQKASCTLEAGVRIYSMRVDSTHSEAYKVLGAINRVGKGDEQDPAIDDVNAENDQDKGHPRKDQERKLSPLSTLESSFDSLNVKKFDAAFAVDPLYHQTSAQFDEGGAKGLLLNNLGIYGNCCVLFDSSEIPGKLKPEEIRHDRTDAIDILFAKDCVEQMVLNMPKKDEISPSLRQIICQFSGEMQVPAETDFSDQISPEHTAESFDVDVDDAFDNCGAWSMDHDGGATVVEQGSENVDQISSSLQEDGESLTFADVEGDDRSEGVDDYLFVNLGFSSKQNSWAGPDHWKYRKVKVSEESHKEDGSPVKAKKTKSRKTESEIDFTKALGTDLSHIFAPPKNPKSLFFPANRTPCNRLLPEDCHYQPENLVKLFFRPKLMCLGRRAKKIPGESDQQSEEFGAMPSWDDDGGGFTGTFDDGNTFSDVEESSTLVSQPRQVNKIEVQYDKTSKQVDVQVLKEILWDLLNQTSVKANVQEEGILFKSMLSAFPNECRASASVEDISPHLCFICLLHLANEHGLRIEGCASLDDLTIHLAVS